MISINFDIYLKVNIYLTYLTYLTLKINIYNTSKTSLNVLLMNELFEMKSKDAIESD